jgi:hypothetical protein
VISTLVLLAVGPKAVVRVTFKNSDKNQVNWLPFYKEKPTSLNFIKKPNSGFMICFY